MSRHLYRTDRNKMVFGVCSALAEIFNIDVSLIRVIWALTALCWGAGLVIYVLCGLIFPKE